MLSNKAQMGMLGAGVLMLFVFIGVFVLGVQIIDFIKEPEVNSSIISDPEFNMSEIDLNKSVAIQGENKSVIAEIINDSSRKDDIISG